jgi:hypothetical protein
MKGFLLPLTGIVLVACCVGGSAQSRDGVRTACAGDRQTYCADAGHGHGVECLASQMSRLSPDCAGAVKGAMEPRQNSQQ